MTGSSPAGQQGSPGPSASSLLASLPPLPPNPSSTLLSPNKRPKSGLNRSHTALPSLERPSPGSAQQENEAAGGVATLQLDDSLSAKTMHALLQPTANQKSLTSVAMRQAREKRRRDVLHLQKWFQDHSSNLPSKSSPSDASPFGNLKSPQEACEEAITQLKTYIAAGSNGGDDIAAEILAEVWQTSLAVSKQQQQRLRKEALAAKERALKAEEQLSQLNLKLKLPGIGSADGSDGSNSSRRESANSALSSARSNYRPASAASGNNAALAGGGAGMIDNCMQEADVSAEMVNEAVAAATAALKAENSKLQAMIENCRRDLATAVQRAATLENVISDASEAEARAEAAEAELEQLRAQMGQLTPRPRPEHKELRALLGEEGRVELALSALEENLEIPVEDLAALLVAQKEKAEGEKNSEGGGSEVISSTNSSGAAPVASNEVNSTDRANIDSVTAASSPSPSLSAPPPPSVNLSSIAESSKTEDHKGPENAASAMIHPCAPPEIAFSPKKQEKQSRFRGALAGTAPAPLLAEALSRARDSTIQRYSALETLAVTLKTQCNDLTSELESFREAERKREAARRRREEEAQLEKKNAVQQYLDLLSSQGEEAWKDQLIGMGQGADVPKLYRHSGKIRNKQMSKRETEKLVKELWKERLVDPAVAAGRAGELVDFVGAYLQKKVGIAAAVIELGYNFLYGLWLYQYDADCELFLKILTGEIREEVYIAQAKLQSDLEELFAALDKAKGQATGTIPKEDLRIALSSFFRVGQSGGKSLTRFDEVMQALDQDQPSAIVEWKKIFEEDREFNQGEFAECLRDQFLQERIEFFQALETALYEEAGNGEDCTKAQVIQACLRTDPECSEKTASAVVGGIFFPGMDTLSIKVVMKKLSRGMMRGSGAEDRGSASGGAGRKSNGARGSTAVGGGKGRNSGNAGNSPGKPGLLVTAKKQHEGIGRALEAVRLEWIQRQLAQKKE